MNNQKPTPFHAIAKLFQSSGRTHMIEKNLKAAFQAEACYKATPMPRI